MKEWCIAYSVPCNNINNSKFNLGQFNGMNEWLMAIIKWMLIQLILRIHNKFWTCRHQRNNRNRQDDMNGSILHFTCRKHSRHIFSNALCVYRILMNKNSLFIVNHYNTSHTWSNVWMIRSFISSFHSSPICDRFRNYLKYLFTTNTTYKLFSVKIIFSTFDCELFYFSPSWTIISAYQLSYLFVDIVS